MIGIDLINFNDGMSQMMSYSPIGCGFGSSGIWALSQLLVWIGIFVLVGWIAYRFLAGKYDDSLKILQRRYAKGEISKKQFAEMKKDLGY